MTLLLSRRRRIAYAAIAMLMTMGVCLLALTAVDVYLHRRVQNLGAVNVWGYRGPVVPARQPNERRVVVLGGSTAFGYGVPYNEAFPAYLESLLNRERTQRGRYRVINLGAPAQGAYGFRFDLEDYAYLRYDAAILYEGYNDLGTHDLPNAVPPRDGPNYLLWRRQSPVFRLTGYFPVLPLVFREKAMALRSGGQLDAAYRGEVVFKPGLAARATAATLQAAATIAEDVGTQLGRLTDVSQAATAATDVETWKHYTGSVVAAVRFARARGVKVLVVTQPYASDMHVRQQRALANALAEAFGSDDGVRYVDLGRVIDLQDRSIAYDGLHLVAKGNETIAQALVGPVDAMFR